MSRLAEYRDYLRLHPKLTYLFAELTDLCNLSCLHCGSSCGGSRGRFLNTELLSRTLGEVAEDFEPRTVMICLTGGEPLMHPDFFKIAGKIQSIHVLTLNAGRNLSREISLATDFPTCGATDSGHSEATALSYAGDAANAPSASFAPEIQHIHGISTKMSRCSAYYRQ